MICIRVCVCGNQQQHLVFFSYLILSPAILDDGRPTNTGAQARAYDDDDEEDDDDDDDQDDEDEEGVVASSEAAEQLDRGDEALGAFYANPDKIHKMAVRQPNQRTSEPTNQLTFF